MELSFTEKKSIRKNFGKLKESLSIPNLIDVQKNSYKQFLTPKPKDSDYFSYKEFHVLDLMNSWVVDKKYQDEHPYLTNDFLKHG